jgi:hypothetical protein
VSSFEHEIYEEVLIPGVGHRIDFNLTDEDAVEGTIVEIVAAATLAAPAGIPVEGGIVQEESVACLPFAALGDSDYFILTDTLGDEWAAAAQKYIAAVAEQDEIQFVDVAGMTDGEYLIITSQAGDEWAVAADLTGTSPAPTGARWAAIPAANKLQLDLSAVVDAEDVGLAFIAAFNALPGFNAAITLANAVPLGLIDLLQLVDGAVPLPESFLEDDSAPGSVVSTQIVEGVDLSVEPTGARWLAVPAANRVFVDVSAAVTDDDVATAIAAELNALVGFAGIFVLDAVTTPGTILIEHIARGFSAAPAVFNADDSGAGTFLPAVLIPGVFSAIDVAADTITILPDPGWITGREVAYVSTGALPDGLLGTTDGFVIRVGPGVYQIAATLVDALAGTEMPLISQGAAGAIITFTAVGGGINGLVFNSMQKLSNAELDAAIAAAEIFDINAVGNVSHLLGQIGLDFSASLINRLTIAPLGAVGTFAFPALMLPHITIRVDAPALRCSQVRITRRGVK